MLSIIEGRVIGCLLEKERTVPDQYPLSQNALVQACNQSTSRDPVMHVADHEVDSTLAALKSQGMVRFVHPAHGRSVTRYRQVVDESWGLDGSSAAIVAVLLLRGPQTVAELRIRTERLHTFESPEAIERVLRDMAAAGQVRLLERQLGHKELRWQQLLAEESEPVEAPLVTRSGLASATINTPAVVDRLAQLEARVARLEEALGDLLPGDPD